MLRDRVEQTTQTTGSGSYTLDGIVTGKRTFAAAFPNGAKVIYVVAKDGAWECNEGTLNTGVAPNQLSRDRLIKSSTGSAIVWGDASDKQIFCDAPAELFGPIGGKLITATHDGASTVNALVLLTNVETPVFVDGLEVEFEAAGMPTATVTAKLNALVAKPVLFKSGDQAGHGAWEQTARVRLVADESLDSWIVVSGHRPGSNVGADIASAATLAKPADARDGSHHRITGTTTIANLWSGAPNGIEHHFEVVTGFTITNGANLICPSGANIAAAAGDRFRIRHLGADVWAITDYTRFSGKALVETPVVQKLAATYYAEYTANADLSATIPLDDTTPTSSEGTQILSIAGVVVASGQRVRARFTGYGVAATSNARKICPIFRGTTCLNVGSNQEYGATLPGPDCTEVEETPGAGTYTYSVRAGASTGNMRFNGNAAGRLFGGASRAVLIVEVYNP
jgi:hypothetical protein